MKRLTNTMIRMLDYSYTEKSFYMYEAKEELNLTDRGTKIILNRLQNEGLIKYEIIGTDFLKFNVQLTTKGLDVWDVWVNSWKINTIDELIDYMEKWENKYTLETPHNEILAGNIEEIKEVKEESLKEYQVEYDDDNFEMILAHNENEAWGIAEEYTEEHGCIFEINLVE